MWLLPLVWPASRAAIGLFYRFEVDGSPPPPTGPVLLLANHPNGLLDPAVVAAAARRPVRFLAKSTLFGYPAVGRLVRAFGSIPVYRRQDDATQTARNVDTFEAVHRELAGGAAIGIFPEGISHSEPSMARLKTGAARIALGFRDRSGERVTVIPVGIVLRDKTVFRSEAMALLGDPIAWDDLASRGAGDRDAVVELTGRIDRGLREVTINLQSWEDRPLVECAEAIWKAETAADPRPIPSVERIATATRVLADPRRRNDPRRRELAARIRDFDRRLRLLDLEPGDLDAPPGRAAALRWTMRRLYLLAPPSLAIAAVGYAAFWIPYRLTGILAGRLPPIEEMQGTYKTLVGAVVYTGWVLAVAVAVGLLAGPSPGLLAALALPVLGLAGLVLRERWRGAWRDARRFLVTRSRPDTIRTLRDERAALMGTFRFSR